MISTMGRSPFSAAPSATPVKPFSAIGIGSTRSGQRSRAPLVKPLTPPRSRWTSSPQDDDGRVARHRRRDRLRRGGDECYLLDRAVAQVVVIEKPLAAKLGEIADDAFVTRAGIGPETVGDPQHIAARHRLGHARRGGGDAVGHQTVDVGELIGGQMAERRKPGLGKSDRIALPPGGLLVLGAIAEVAAAAAAHLMQMAVAERLRSPPGRPARG